jgi:hypothetical protein
MENTISWEKAQIINELVDLSDHMNEIWKYHPNNPNHIDIVKLYDELSNKYTELTVKLDKAE